MEQQRPEPILFNGLEPNLFKYVDDPVKHKLPLGPT
jgi:hypothetical protein